MMKHKVLPYQTMFASMLDLKGGGNFFSSAKSGNSKPLVLILADACFQSEIVCAYPRKIWHHGQFGTVIKNGQFGTRTIWHRCGK